jgi:phage virion morphogenesis protein
MIEVEWNGRAVHESLQNLQQQVSNLRPVLLAIGEDLVDSTKRRFETSTGPDEQRWADNSEVTIDKKGRNKPLVDQGNLLRQISYDVVGSDTLIVGSAMEYAAMQQFGGTKTEFPALWGDIPARSFLVFLTMMKEKLLIQLIAIYYLKIRFFSFVF